MNEPTLEQLLETELATGRLLIGELAVSQNANGGYELKHRDIADRSKGVSPVGGLDPDAALEIAKFDDAGNYRPLRTAPNLRHGWKIIASNISEVIEAIDAIYPGRLAVWRAWKSGTLITTPLRQTLHRQSGMYRVAAKISDEQINELVTNFCRSQGGCLRTILWRRDEAGRAASNRLPPEKFDPAFDQTGHSEKCIPLLCQEACNLLVAACREAVKEQQT